LLDRLQYLSASLALRRPSGAVATNPTLVAEPHKKFGAASIETVERLWLLKAFLKLAPQAAIEIIELIERLASAPPASDHPSSRQVLRPITRAEALIEVKVLCLTFTLVDERKERSRPTKFGASFPGRWEEFIVGPHPFG